jgi:hypothetical protein
MISTDVSHLDGKLVLVASARDWRNPPTGRRGTIFVRERDGAPLVQISVDFPQMFTVSAHQRTITLDDAAVARLLESERDGTYQFTVDDRLDPEAPPGNE